ncbi:unnamed protein product [Zymoseptoria tritici ST99CH_3D1]|nr:unnamed protein product [Zymoseptoria tritici ST99CH_3D1]
MATSSYSRSLVSSVKRLKLSTPTPIPTIHTRCIHHSPKDAATPSPSLPLPASLERSLASLRLPLAVQATYLTPLKRAPTSNLTSADLQLRSYSIRNLEVFADFALRAAYYLHLPAKGPILLPKKVERWTVPRGNFVHKKSQENFERLTLRRWVRIVDGHPETVSVWLAFLRKYQYYGVGMKADVWESGSLEAGRELDEEAKRIEGMMGEGGEMEMFFAGDGSFRRGTEKGKKLVMDQVFKGAGGADGPLGGAGGARNARGRFEKITPGGGEGSV